eukprot:675631-Amphidinium_carterae.2
MLSLCIGVLKIVLDGVSLGLWINWSKDCECRHHQLMWVVSIIDDIASFILHQSVANRLAYAMSASLFDLMHMQALAHMRAHTSRTHTQSTS